MNSKSSFPALLFCVIAGMGCALAYVPYALHGSLIVTVVILCAAFAVALLVSSAIKVASPWDRAVVLRLGQFRKLSGPGVFGIIPIINTIPYWIDTRVITTSFKAEKTLTKDTVPVDVDAVLFWKVVDPEKAALAVADYVSAISWASQTALRDIIGKTHARRHARRTRQDLGPTAEDHRPAHRAVGRQRGIGRGQGCPHPAWRSRMRCRCRPKRSASDRPG